MISDGPAAWPESIAFKRLMRGLLRDRAYVPPYQPGSGALLASDEAPGPERAQPQQITVGDWLLTTNDRGDVVWRHLNGYEQVVAALPEGEGHHG